MKEAVLEKSAFEVQWNPSKADTVKTNVFVLHRRGVPNSGVSHNHAHSWLWPSVTVRIQVAIILTVDSRFTALEWIVENRSGGGITIWSLAIHSLILLTGCLCGVIFYYKAGHTLSCCPLSWVHMNNIIITAIGQSCSCCTMFSYFHTKKKLSDASSL